MTSPESSTDRSYGGHERPPITLTDRDLLRELGTTHRTRHKTLRHGSDRALAQHTQRMEELEREYLARFPEREVDPEREREDGTSRG